jgi:diguanylate cyclase (GGDEF)-like protein
MALRRPPTARLPFGQRRRSNAAQTAWGLLTPAGQNGFAGPNLVQTMRDDRLDDEEGRIAALRRYEALDTGDDKPFQRIVELVQTVLGVPAAAITLVDGERQWYKAARGISSISVPRADSFCDETIHQTGPLAVTDTHLDKRFATNRMVVGSPHIRSYLGVPLTTPDSYNIGTLCAIDTEPRPFDARQGEILRKFAEIVIEQFELRQVAKQDPMTGALTRAGFFAEVEKEFRRASRYDRPSALVLIDVDHFHAINDRYGHGPGDAVLISIASACMSAMRKSDIFGRVGGEEFGLLLPETEPEEARDAAERIRNVIEATIVETPGAEIRATVSLGIAPIPAAAEGPSTWIAEADIALYEAKNFGRNRSVLSRARRPTPAITPLEQQAGHLN